MPNFDRSFVNSPFRIRKPRRILDFGYRISFFRELLSSWNESPTCLQLL